MKILVTGSHLTVAQSVIEELQQDKNNDIYYLGRASTREGDASPSVESKLLPSMGVKFFPLITGRLQMSLTRYTIPSLLKMPIGFLQSFYYLVRIQPDVIVGFGGYISVPVIICGWLLSIPILIHEQTLVSGLANTIAGIFADKIAVSYDTDYRFSKAKTILTGNPIRKQLLKVAKSDNAKLTKILDTKKKLIYVTGGSQGAHVINETILEILQLLKHFAVIIQCGDSKFNDYQTLSNVDHPEALVQKWFDASDVAGILKRADLVISRSGINTLNELAYFSKPTICIPYPYLYQDEQQKNADFFAQFGLVQVIRQKNLSAKILLDKILEMLSNLAQYQNKKQAKSTVIPDAAKRIALEIKLLYASKKI